MSRFATESSTPHVSGDALDQIEHSADNIHEKSRKEAEKMVPFTVKKSNASFWIPAETSGKDHKLERKELYKDAILRFLVNTDNDFPTRTQLAQDVCGFKGLSGLYVHFTPNEISEIEQEALRLRRLQYSRDLAKVDIAMFRAAQAGDTAAAKLVYERFEGAAAKTLNINHTGEVALRGILDHLADQSATAIDAECEVIN